MRHAHRCLGFFVSFFSVQAVDPALGWTFPCPQASICPACPHLCKCPVCHYLFLPIFLLLLILLLSCLMNQNEQQWYKISTSCSILRNNSLKRAAKAQQEEYNALLNLLIESREWKAKIISSLMRYIEANLGIQSHPLYYWSASKNL